MRGREEGCARGRLPPRTRLVARDCTRLLRWAAAAGMIPCCARGLRAGHVQGVRLVYAHEHVYVRMCTWVARDAG